MERPSCKTCPYWAHAAQLLPDADTVFGRRVRKIIDMHLSGATVKEIAAAIGRTHKATAKLIDKWCGAKDGECRHRVEFVPRSASDWCGEHPDFPTYIAATRSPSNGSPAADPPRE